MLSTTINGRKLYNTIAREILENPNVDIIENLYEVDSMISYDVKIDNLYDAAMNIRDVEFENNKIETIAEIKAKVSKLEDVKGEFP